MFSGKKHTPKKRIVYGWISEMHFQAQLIVTQTNLIIRLRDIASTNIFSNEGFDVERPNTPNKLTECRGERSWTSLDGPYGPHVGHCVSN